ncbi:MAG: hypothetical protein HBSAPP03_18830 [Phycisphaerae bacterium]|nr:MAG: hypothetical protein HBSAPP03_18830 [Phycisphaerae bacterium]
MTQPPDPTPPTSIPEDTLTRAFGAFKKRHKLTKLDHESRLGASRPMTSGKKVENMGIVPPTDYPREVWKELARVGRIKDMGGGFYSMP